MNPQVYRGRIALGYGEDDEALMLSGSIEPLAEQISDDLDYLGRFATVRYWISDTESTIEELIENLIVRAAGAIEADYTQCYSEITGYLWTDAELKVGGHDLLAELASHVGRYLHLEIRYATTDPTGQSS